MKLTKLFVLKSHLNDGHDYNAIEKRLNQIDGVTAVVLPGGIDFEIVEIDQEPRRRVFYVDCGEAPPHKQQQRLTEFKEMFAKASVQADQEPEDTFIPISSNYKFSKVEIID